MNHLAFLFSGTGSQCVGMGKELYEQFAEFRQVYACASDIFGFDVARLSFDGTAEQIAGTVISHRLIYAMSVGVHEVAKSRLPQPCAYAGHSLGELAALTACGVFTLEQGCTALKWRSQYLDDASQGLDGAMVAILGCGVPTIEMACAEADGFAVPVNYNSPTQTVISGDSAAVAAAVELLKAQGAKAIQLGTSVPFHTTRLQSAADRLQESLSTLSYNQQPAAKFFCNVTGRQMSDFSQLPAYLAQQMVSPVRFVDELLALHAAGMSAYVELGPGKVLTGLVKKTLKGASALNINDPQTLENAVALLS